MCSKTVWCVASISLFQWGSGRIGKAICFEPLPVDKTSTLSYRLCLPLFMPFSAEKNRDVLLKSMWASAKFITLSASK